MKLPGYTFLFKKFLYPIYNWMIGRATFETAQARIDNQNLEPQKIKEIQLQKLKAVLVNAGKNVPYYRRKFAELNFDPAALTSLEQFEALDFYVTKAEVKADPSAFISEVCDRSKLTWHRTGGSTGEPLNFPTDPLTNSTSAAAIVQALSWWGIEMGERHAMFWGSPQFIIRRPTDHLKKFVNVLRNKLMNRLFISNYNLNDKNISSYRKKLEDFSPTYVRGMPSSLYLFAKTTLQQRGPLKRGAPKVVHSACEQLFDWQREVIERGFNSRVVNTYGLSELADVAYEAPCGNLHVMDEDVYIQLKDFGVGEHEIVATQLNNLMSPLIKYRTADMADGLEYCECCEIKLRILRGLKGRAHDFIVAPDGRFLHGQLFTHLVVFESGIKNYQIVQKKKDLIVCSIVKGEGFAEESENRLRMGIKNYMGSDVVVAFNYLDAIPLTKSGKHRWIISEIVAELI